MHGWVKVRAPVAKSRKPRASRCGFQRERSAINGDLIALIKGGIAAEFEPLHLGVDESACGSAFDRGFANQRPAFQRLPNGEAGAALLPIKKDWESPVPDSSIYPAMQPEAVLSQFIENLFEIAPKPFWQQIFIVQAHAESFEISGSFGLEQVGSDAVPKKGYTSHPVSAWQGFDRAKLDEPERSGGPCGVPKLVEAHFAAVRIAGDVGLKMAQRLIDELSMVARRQRLQEGVSHIDVVEIARRFIRTRSLRGCAHVATREKVCQGRVVMPETENRREPGGPGEKRIRVKGGAAPKQVVSTARALRIVP